MLFIEAPPPSQETSAFISVVSVPIVLLDAVTKVCPPGGSSSKAAALLALGFTPVGPLGPHGAKI